MNEAEVSSNRIDQIVVIVLLSAAVAIVTVLNVYYLIIVHASVPAYALGQPVWLFFLAWVFSPLGGGILIILGIWQKIVRHDTLGWYGGIIGIGVGMIIGYVTFFILLFLFSP